MRRTVHQNRDSCNMQCVALSISHTTWAHTSVPHPLTKHLHATSTLSLSLSFTLQFTEKRKRGERRRGSEEEEEEEEGRRKEAAPTPELCWRTTPVTRCTTTPRRSWRGPKSRHLQPQDMVVPEARSPSVLCSRSSCFVWRIPKAW